MINHREIFSSEDISERHHYMFAGRTYDLILDASFECDPFPQVACENIAAEQRVAVVEEVKSMRCR